MDSGANIRSTERVEGRAFVLADVTSDGSSSSRLEALQIGGGELSKPQHDLQAGFKAIKTCTPEISSTVDDTISFTVSRYLP